jgi:hypothetical protein
VTSYEEDRAWADKFLPHQKEIAEKAIRVETAPIEEDLRRNTDLILRTAVPIKNREIRISARVRRHQYVARFRDEFTIRLDRPSGADTEMVKMQRGYGDFVIYGFESEPDSDRLFPWFIGNTELLRDYVNCGGYIKQQRNRDGSSTLGAVHLADMPIGFVLAHEGLTVWDNDRVWEQCRRCWWWKSSGGLVLPTNDDLEPGDGYGRLCIACGFRWRSGWVMRLTRKSA